MFSFEASQEMQFAIHVMGLQFPDLYRTRDASLEKLKECIYFCGENSLKV